MTTNTNANTNALGDTPPTVCPRCTGPCTLPGEGPTGQLGGLCTVCGWDYLVADDADELTAAERETRCVAGLTNRGPQTLSTSVPTDTICPRWCAGDHTTLLGDDDASVVTVHRHVTTDAADPFTVAVEVWTGEGEATAGVYVDAPAADNLTPAQARAFAAALVEAAALV